MDIVGKLILDTDKVQETLTTFIQTQISQAGFQHAVVGVSGGVDSALTCFLTAAALGPENVLAIRMPYKTSSPESLEHASLVIEATGVNEKTIPITEMADAFLELVPDANPIRRGNVMARSRMIVLYDQSAAFEGLVAGTGNKTEVLFGYTTLYGDAACAFNPLGDLYKTQVRQLARTIGVPEVIVAKPPSADLWVGQTDEEELGFTYEEADQLLYLLIEEQYSIQSCVEAGFDASLVESVVKQIQRSQFKRVMPPIAKVNRQTVGIEFLEPPDWKI
jgi:NAD+ synthase